jgi:hypothetical protein
MRSIRLVTTLLPVLAGLAASSCAPVKAYERGRLAKPKMQLDPSPEATVIEQHVYEYREGSAGGYGSLGGGCGCN